MCLLLERCFSRLSTHRALDKKSTPVLAGLKWSALAVVMLVPLCSADTAEEKPPMPVISNFRRQMRRRPRTVAVQDTLGNERTFDGVGSAP